MWQRGTWPAEGKQAADVWVAPVTVGCQQTGGCSSEPVQHGKDMNHQKRREISLSFFFSTEYRVNKINMFVDGPVKQCLGSETETASYCACMEQRACSASVEDSPRSVASGSACRDCWTCLCGPAEKTWRYVEKNGRKIREGTRLNTVQFCLNT